MRVRQFACSWLVVQLLCMTSCWPTDVMHLLLSFVHCVHYLFNISSNTMKVFCAVLT